MRLFIYLNNLIAVRGKCYLELLGIDNIRASLCVGLGIVIKELARATLKFDFSNLI